MFSVKKLLECGRCVQGSLALADTRLYIATIDTNNKHQDTNFDTLVIKRQRIFKTIKGN
jgi:hypothetical protein